MSYTLLVLQQESLVQQHITELQGQVRWLTNKQSCTLLQFESQIEECCKSDSRKKRQLQGLVSSQHFVLWPHGYVLWYIVMSTGEICTYTD